MQNFFDWGSQTALTGPNECVGTEIPEFLASFFCLFGAPASRGSLSSSVEEACLVPGEFVS